MSNVLDFGVNGQTPSKVGGLGITVKYFPRLLGASIGVAPLTPSVTSAVGALFLPGGNVFNGQSFNVLASGYFGSDTGDPSGTVLVDIYGVTGTTAAPIYTALGVGVTITPFYTIEPFAISLSLVGGSSGGANGILVGSYQASARASVTAPTIVPTILSGLDFTNGNSSLGQGAVLGFVVGVTFGTTSATNAAALTEFTIES